MSEKTVPTMKILDFFSTLLVKKLRAVMALVVISFEM